MKYFYFLIVISSFLACRQPGEANVKKVDGPNQFPKAITEVFKAHGGLALWYNMRSLEFEIQKQDQNELTITDLKSRKSFVDLPNHSIGYNGTKVWLLNKDTVAYKGNAKFYHNLMFYFFAMPFVLADDGIIYSEVKPLEFEGKQYPGIKITYSSGVGESPDDEYVLYFDPKTNQMVWLAYTVTYFSKEKSKTYHFIKYDSWQSVDGLKVPKTLVWFNYENNLPTTERNRLEFTEVKFSETPPKATVFEKPEDAAFVD
ncbi:DUF6503 family protein [Snuella sedimenti]|uniref:Uncharacterized protein n=1 Tax=Snuella sedimenti TaxID=2798802 RepID=A0A8J7IUS9_9FLAO|nr:DUF6503 family protein [Snuella sedimenti]MBJ6368360.1 hypothetical protein [Snuella sedimenti]